MTVAIKERPILMNGEMVRAVLSGRKKQTRRLLKPQPPSKQFFIDNHCAQDCSFYEVAVNEWRMSGAVGRARDEMGSKWPKSHLWECPYGAVGDRLYVRENFAIVPHPGDVDRPRLRIGPGGQGITWQADWQGNPSGFKWKPSIHMPRWASRITLEITGVRVERLNAISEQDAIAEGIDVKQWNSMRRLGGASESVNCFRSLWESINGIGSWDLDPYLWVIEFKRIS